MLAGIQFIDAHTDFNLTISASSSALQRCAKSCAKFFNGFIPFKSTIKEIEVF